MKEIQKYMKNEQNANKIRKQKVKQKNLNTVGRS